MMYVIKNILHAYVCNQCYNIQKKHTFEWAWITGWTGVQNDSNDKRLVKCRYARYVVIYALFIIMIKQHVSAEYRSWAIIYWNWVFGNLVK